MIPIPDEENPYGTAHFMHTRTYVGWRGPIIAKAIKEELNPTRVVDVGCGIGEIAKGLLDLGVDAYGIEGSTAGQEYYKLPLSRYLYTDIRHSFPITNFGFFEGITFDLVICLEVLSVIENKDNCHDVIIENLRILSDNILMNRIDKIFGYKEDTETMKRIQSHLMPWKHKGGMKSLFTAKFFRKET